MSAPAVCIDPGLMSQLCNGLSERELQTLFKAATRQRFFANTVVYTQESTAHSFFLLVEGRARHFYVTPEGRKVLLAWIKPGESFGIGAMLSFRRSYILSVETVVNSMALAWDKRTIRGLALRHPKLMDNIMSIMGNCIEWLVAAHLGLTSNRARFRLAQAVVNLARDFGGNSRHGGIELDVTNEDLANAANVTPFTASRLLREWQRRGLLTKTRGKLLLRSAEKLLASEHLTRLTPNR